MKMDNNTLNDIFGQFTKNIRKPEVFLVSSDAKHQNHLKQLLKQQYDIAKNAEWSTTKSNSLPELITGNFDLEQIWQQIELLNEDNIDRSVAVISKLVTKKDGLVFPSLNSLLSADNGEASTSDLGENEGEDLDAAEGATDYQNESEDLQSESDEESGNEEINHVQHGKSSIVDDQFFKLGEMEQFLQKQESGQAEAGSEESESEASIDLFEDTNEDEEEDEKQKNPRYKDFFRHKEDESKKPKRNKFFDEEVQDEDLAKSTLQLREGRLKTRIDDIEEQALREKPWQLKGEITADGRPQNSLLEEVVDFDLISRPAPVITKETTIYLEDVIRQRIKDKVFDSVVRKEKPVETPWEYKKKLMLDQEKSKESLAQIYEKEYLQQKEALDPEAANKEEEEPELHRDIRTMMHELFSKLDALSNFHFTPKPAAPEIKIVTNLPALSMEEVAPVTNSEASLLAPEEVKKKFKGDLIGKKERTDTDKKRERRKKKLKQQIHAQVKKKRDEKKLGLANKHNKGKVEKSLNLASKHRNVEKMDESVYTKPIKSSTAFFTTLEEEVKTSIKSKTQVKRRQDSKHDVKRLKL